MGREGSVAAALLLASAVVVSSGCGGRHSPPVLQPSRPHPPHPQASGARVRVQVHEGSAPRVITLDLEEYVRRSVGAEIVVAAEDAPWAGRIYEAQAIVARTYALASLGRHERDGFDLCSTTHCQLLAHPPRAGRWDDVIAAAVDATRGLVVAYGGAPISALFHSHCGGHTSDATIIWPGAPVPYLRGVPDEFCLRERPAEWTFRIAARTLARDLDGSRATRVEGRIDGFQVVERDEAGRVRTVALTGARDRIMRGEELRRAIMQAHGPASLRSPRYTVRREGDRFVFEGEGFGHGAGLCQTGMVGRIKAGRTPADVLTYYFPGTRIAAIDALTS